MNLEELRARLGPTAPPRLTPRRSGRMRLEDAVPGREIDGPRGSCFVVDSTREHLTLTAARHLEAVADTRVLRLPLSTSQLEPVEFDPRSAAFIDTETTGLGYGVGTHVFMVGVGRLEDDAFHVRQFFLRHPGEETAMLASLAEFLTDSRRWFPSMDVHSTGRYWRIVLSTSGSYWNRRAAPRRPPAPIPAAVEAASRIVLAGFDRANHPGRRRTQDDVEGWMIPQLYFQYLRTGMPGPCAAFSTTTCKTSYLSRC